MLDAASKVALKQGVKADASLVESRGRPVSDVILDEARKWRADLIVMGTHGRRGVNRLLLGSDAERVLRSAPVPVLLVRPEERKKRAARKRR
jgi:nucleotide-binding universal stress UspA family protein